MFRKIYSSALALLITGALVAQSSGIKVHITDKVTKAALPFVNIVVEQGDRQVSGTMTDDKGYAELKPLDPGTYNIKAQYEGYHDYVVQGVIVNADQLTHLEAPMVGVADTSIKVTIMRYRVPLINPRTTSGGVADSEDIHHMAANDINSVAANIPGVYSSDVGSGLNIRGGRQDATSYIIDGQKVTGDQALGALPISLIDQETVITGGMPAKYGDASGGIVEVTTLSGTDHFFGSVQGATSDLFDSYGYNDANWSVGGPLWSKKDSNKNKKTIMDFVFGGEYTYQKDQNPSFLGTTFVNPTVLTQEDANPLTPGAQGGFTRSAEYTTSDQIVDQSWHQNDAQDVIGLSGKLNYHVSDNMKITAGGSYQYTTQHDWTYVYQMYNASEDPLDQITNYRGFIRLTQKFYTPVGKDKSSLIKNAFYSIQAEYSHTNQLVDNGNFGLNYFDYGYVGQFYQVRTPFYTYNQNGPLGAGNYQTSYTNSQLLFTPSDMNGVEANYTKDVYNGLGAAAVTDPTVVESNLGLMNGDRPGNVYSLWFNVGRSYGGTFEQDANHFRFSADFSAEIADNSIQIGFEYEQNSISQYNTLAVQLWTLMRQLANFQLTSFNTDTAIVAKTGTNNTYNYNYNANSAQQTQFDKSLREKIGASATQWIQPDDYAPSTYSLSMFSAADLLQQGGGSATVNYMGYSYTGNLSSSNPSIDDFFNQKDANGNNTYPMGAFQPIYMAGYIQDHFDIKSMVFDVGLRVEQYNANQEQLKDPYLLYSAYTAGTTAAKELGSIPSNIGSDYVVYVNNIQSPTAIVGYRNGNDWYDAGGNLVSDPTVIASATTTGTIQPYLQNPSQATINSTAFTTYTPQTEVLPRLAFSFPITDKANFFAHYDVMAQRPLGVTGPGTTDGQLQYGSNVSAFQAINYLDIQAYSGYYGVLPNPALVPELTTDYELGFAQVLDEAKSMSLTFSAFYRDFKDQVQTYNFLDAYPVGYVAYANIDFGTVKGFSISYALNRLGNWSDIKMRASYNLSFATGTGSGPQSGFNLASSGNPNLQIPQALDYDQRHTITTNLDFHFASGANYDGPVWTTHSGKAVQILANAGINVNFSAGSGTPYTQWSIPTELGQGIAFKHSLVGSINGDNLPWQNRVDVKADKTFKVTIKSHPCQLNVYISATNLFNAENVLQVYNYTGSPTDDGFLESAAGKQVINAAVSPQSFIAQYQAYERVQTSPLNNFALPREARLGLIFNF